MNVQKSNTNFGMAFISPSSRDMNHFKNYLTKETKQINKRSLGNFIINQSKNTKTNIQYKHTKKGDMFLILSNRDSSVIKTIDCKNNALPDWKNDFIQKEQKIKNTEHGIKKFYELFKLNILRIKKEREIKKYKGLPTSMINAGEAANKIEKETV